ncbi:winged helix-turn-helix transcriptional regulator [Silvibacterium dinghuense]|uniref:Transcriptional regulator n=1 Tax=Silvibacterium dinghuense TaxID=1560006 RepID=A0A4Q1SBW2_9BACT|nr:helix-turn-helix domain-containing protein [Silvibacterium dinghuense]RXS94320.1 transcriptional regulator [Silvibacterium dinghuense]GGH16923.1 ArsR family transcriptional regulator [Silvibacterium dinghuense]
MTALTLPDEKEPGKPAATPPEPGDPATDPQIDPQIDPKIEKLTREIIERVADKWTMLVIEALATHGILRFMQIGERVDGISLKMLTRTLRQLEHDGLVVRTVHPVIPPHVDYELTHLGLSLSEAFCGVWIWAETHHEEIERARKAFPMR